MKNLAAFVAQQNLRASVFGGKQLDAKNLSADDRAKLADALDSALSPENLCCDGELRGRALQQKSRMLNGALRELQALEGK
ncbi:MAG TPA: hypothetical protein VLE97_11055 [Gaiellaceae bacterium]|nr:hypothetical protein [Gaiellaceae bacterium]